MRDEGTEGRAHVLRAPIAVEDQAAWWATALKRSVEDGAGLARSATSTERPREHATRVMIQHDREIAPAVRQAEIGDVADPDLVVPGHRRGPHPIRMLGEPRANPRLGAIAAHGFRAKAGRPHEAGDTTTTDRPPGTPQLAIEPRTAVA